MSPAIIDLTSSPEPEESPGKVAAEALKRFRAGKQRNVGISALDDEEDAGDASAALKIFQPRKQNGRPRVNRSEAPVPSDSFVPLVPKEIGTVAPPGKEHRPNGDGTPTATQYPVRPFLLNQAPESRGHIAAAPPDKQQKNGTKDSHLTAAQHAMRSFIPSESPRVTKNSAATQPYEQSERSEEGNDIAPTKSTGQSVSHKQHARSKGRRWSSNGIEDGSLASLLLVAEPTDAIDAMRALKRRRIDQEQAHHTLQLLNGAADVRNTSLGIKLHSGNVMPIHSGSPDINTPAISLKNTLSRALETAMNEKTSKETHAAGSAESIRLSANKHNSLARASNSAEGKYKPQTSKDGSGPAGQGLVPAAIDPGKDNAVKQTHLRPSTATVKSAGAAKRAVESSAATVAQSGQLYTPDEDALLIKLKEEDNLSWSAIAKYFPNRAWTTLQSHYSNRLKRRPRLTVADTKRLSRLEPIIVEEATRPSKHTRTGNNDRQPRATSSDNQIPMSAGSPVLARVPALPKVPIDEAYGTYTSEDAALLTELKEEDGLSWSDIRQLFPNRTENVLQLQYSKILKRRENGASVESQSSRCADNNEAQESSEPEDGPVRQTSPSHPRHPSRPMSTAINVGPDLLWTAQEDALLIKLKEKDELSWDEIARHLPSRTRAAIEFRYSSRLKNRQKDPVAQVQLWTAEEDALLIKLKEGDELSWDEIAKRLPSRARTAIQTRYSSKLKYRPNGSTIPGQLDGKGSATTICRVKSARSPSPEHRIHAPRRMKRKNDVSVVNGFVSWADVKKSRRDAKMSRLADFHNSRLANETEEESQTEHALDEPDGDSNFATERAYPKSMPRILRQRELGTNNGRSWIPSSRSVPDELQEQVLDTIGPRKYYNGTSGDVTCLAWASDGERFAAGSIAITDERSMQYNRPRNLLLGDRQLLKELPEHHVRRPQVRADSGNVNGLHPMQEIQDPRLFMTVTNVQFSPDSSTLYSVGCDSKARAYDSKSGSCKYEIEHAAPLDLLSVSNLDVLATACHQSSDGSIGVYSAQEHKLSLSPSRAFQETSRAIYPSALRWGTAPQHSNLLLAGFSIDSIDDERDIAGETCLWDVRAETRLPTGRVTRNVFDIAWNPSASSTSTIFAVACARGAEKAMETRSIVQCFAPNQNRAVPVIRWDCPAFDINDVVYCQHDDNLIAAGATDGKVYVWDQRFAGESNRPLHVLEHGLTLNVLDHDREREIADTGVRFLSWGATSSRLYTGSSDGVVKVWNPKRSTQNSHVEDLATFSSAVMSGAFSPDNRELLIGEDQGRLNLLSVGYKHATVRSMQRFELQSAPAPASEGASQRKEAARQLVESGEIMIRPMGDLPKKQAVQGPNYHGPFLKPSENDTTQAQKEYEKALNDQNDAQRRVDMLHTEPDENESEHALRQATLRVQNLQETLMRMQNREDEFEALEQRATEFQRKLRKRLQRQLAVERSQESDKCALDCNFLPVGTEDDNGAVLDSRRSEARVPGSLFQLSEFTDSSDMTQEDLHEAGLTHKCMSCSGPALKPKKGLALCNKCYRTRNGLTASCEICSAPIRALLGTKLCERCNFSCFRCAQPAYIEDNTAHITCDRCELTWGVGVLGYELVRNGDGK